MSGELICDCHIESETNSDFSWEELALPVVNDNFEEILENDFDLEEEDDEGDDFDLEGEDDFEDDEGDDFDLEEEDDFEEEDDEGDDLEGEDDFEQVLDTPPNFPVHETVIRISQRVKLDPGLVAAQTASSLVLGELKSVESFYANLSNDIANKLISLSNRQAEAYKKIESVYNELATEDNSLNVNSLFSIHLDEIETVWNSIRDARDRLAEIDFVIQDGLKYQKTLPLNNYNL